MLLTLKPLHYFANMMEIKEIRTLNKRWTINKAIICSPSKSEITDHKIWRPVNLVESSDISVADSINRNDDH
jgi:hypothetical protein